MNIVSRMLLALLVILSICSASFADELTPAKRGDIEKLLKITGAMKIAGMFSSAFSSQMYEMLRQTRNDIPERAIKVITEETNLVINENLGSLLDPMVDIYAKNLTHNDILGLIEFYETPLGKKAIEVLPAMTQQGMKAGRDWGQGLAPKLIERVEERLKREKLL